MVTRLPLLDRSNAIVGVIAIFRDVTEQVRAKAKIDDEVRRRDQFLAMLSHELRNPLGAVVSATATLKSDGPRTMCRRDRRACSNDSRGRWRGCSTTCWRRAASRRTRSSCAAASSICA